MNPIGCNSDQLKDIMKFCGYDYVTISDEKKLFFLSNKKKETKKNRKNKKKKNKKNNDNTKIKERSKFSLCSFRETSLIVF